MIGRSLWTSFALDLLYNPHGQQRAGLLWVWIGLRESQDFTLPSEDAEVVTTTFAGRTFNTSGSLAGLVIGPLTRPADEPIRSRAERASDVLAPAIAGIGDRFQYGGWGPSLSAGIVLAAMLWPPYGFLWYLLIIQSVAAYWQWDGWRVGLCGETAVLELLRSRRLERAIRGLQNLARLLFGAVLGSAAVRIWDADGRWPFWIWLPIIGLGILLERRGRVPARSLGWIAAVLVLGLGFATSR